VIVAVGWLFPSHGRFFCIGSEICPNSVCAVAAWGRNEFLSPE
jgi:hypothetical protein